MYSHTTDLARTIVGIVGNIISFGLFISPAKTFWRIYNNQSVEDFQYFPYLAAMMNCLLWVFYGLPFVHPHSTLVVTINSIGLALELIYISIYLAYTNNQTRWNIAICLLVELTILGVIATFTLTLCHTSVERSRLVGICCIVFGILMYGSPLGIMRNVINTKSVDHMPFLLSLASFLNGVIWATYALIEFDLFILISNGVGAILGASQLILYACYFKSTPPVPTTTTTTTASSTDARC